MGPSICLAERSTENSSKLKFQNSCVPRFVSPREVRKILQNLNLKIHGSLDLSRRGKYGKFFKTEISKFMGPSICLAEGSTENSSKLKFQNSWVPRVVSPREVQKIHQN